MRLKHQKGISLLVVALIFSLLGAAAMLALYVFKNGHLPAMPGAAGSVQKLPGAAVLQPEPSQLPQAVSIQSGVRHCQINGKTVYSDSDCPADAKLKSLHDSAGIRSQQPAAVAKPEQADPDQLRQQAIERAIEPGLRK